MKIHLGINYGGEGRFEMVRKTIIVSAPYFSTIKILNYGPDENGNKFNSLKEQFPNLVIANLGSNFHACVTEDLIRYHITNVPDGDWLAFLDSDWRFPQFFLDNMEKEIDICEKEGANAIFSYQLGHCLDENPFRTEFGNTIFNYDQNKLDNIVQQSLKEPDKYGWPLLQKVSKSTLWVDSFLGNHCYYLFHPYVKRIVPYMFHFHFRNFDDYAYCSTMLFQSWWYIGHNVFPVKDHIEIINSWEYSALEEFKNKHSCFTSNSLREMIKNENFLKELKELFLLFKDTNIFGCKQMYRLANEYGMKVWTTPPEPECDGVCCKYKIGRIFDV